MRDVVPKRTEPREEISTPVVPHNRPFTMPQGGDRAWDYAKQAQESGHERDFERAREVLSTMQPSAAVATMETMGLGMLEMYLLAEEDGQARDFILRSFPKPGARARERYGPFMQTNEAAAVGA